jgi:sRNA-binding carbon storage regulator CsrA
MLSITRHCGEGPARSDLHLMMPDGTLVTIRVTSASVGRCVLSIDAPRSVQIKRADAKRTTPAPTHR